MQFKSKSMGVFLTLAVGLGAQAQGLKLESGPMSIKFGFLLQPQFEALESPSKNGTSQNLFIRRTRFLIGGGIGKDFEFFFETDQPNIGKADATGTKSFSGLMVQDAVLTYKPMEEFKVDMGLIILPFAHNSVQGATTLMALDYGSYSFLSSGLINGHIGRDTGVQFRGLLFQKLEYRLGAFQGKRLPQTTTTVHSNNPLRTAGRLQYNFMDAETGMFYGGTYGGSKKILSVGLGFDKQDDYQAMAIDAFVDWPLPNKDVLTFQANHISYDGGKWLVLPKQKTLSVEAGYRLNAWNLSPMLRFEQKTMDKPDEKNLNEKRQSVGLAWWFKGHNSNLKLFYTDIKPENMASTKLLNYKQTVLQWQFFYF